MLNELLGAEQIPDHRCPGLPDEPHSSYCKVCWNPVYSLWHSTEPHHGECPHGCAQAHECEDAIGRAKLRAELAKHRAAPNAEITGRTLAQNEADGA